jgi:hypothetical protein
MAISKSTSFMDDFAGYINQAVKESVGKAYDKALEQAHKDALEKRDEVIAATALKLSSYYSMQDMGTSLRIEIVKTKEQ